MNGSNCCGESNCRRKQPIKLMRGSFSGTWYAVTRYVDLGDGLFEAKEKHELDSEAQVFLEGVRR